MSETSMINLRSRKYDTLLITPVYMTEGTNNNELISKYEYHTSINQTSHETGNQHSIHLFKCLP